VVLILLDQRTRWVDPVRYVLGYVAAPIQYLADLPSEMSGWVADHARSRESLQEENARLKRQILILNQKAQRLAVLESQNVRLRELLNSSARVDAQVLVAEVIGLDPDPNRQELVINKGDDADVFRGQAVLDAEGLLGQVVEVGPFSSRVLLVTDASHALSVQVNRNGVRSILSGTGRSDLMQLLYVPDTADVQEGDLLVSTGLGGRYPGGYPVAEVSSVVHDPGAAFARIQARPRAAMDRVSHVLLVQQAGRVAPAQAGADADEQEQTP
jgi:rod shape-determining protein MreC